MHPCSQDRAPALHRVLAPSERLGKVVVRELRRACDLVVLVARPLAPVVRRGGGGGSGGGGCGGGGGADVGHLGGEGWIVVASKG